MKEPRMFPNESRVEGGTGDKKDVGKAPAVSIEDLIKKLGTEYEEKIRLMHRTIESH